MKIVIILILIVMVILLLQAFMKKFKNLPEAKNFKEQTVLNALKTTLTMFETTKNLRYTESIDIVASKIMEEYKETSAVDIKKYVVNMNETEELVIESIENAVKTLLSK